jgi:hypothetical protein
LKNANATERERKIKLEEDQQKKKFNIANDNYSSEETKLK